jgi:hypothetical protein
MGNPLAGMLACQRPHGPYQAMTVLARIVHTEADLLNGSSVGGFGVNARAVTV